MSHVLAWCWPERSKNVAILNTLKLSRVERFRAEPLPLNWQALKMEIKQFNKSTLSVDLTHLQS
jgi:hypothetical protein